VARLEAAFRGDVRNSYRIGRPTDRDGPDVEVGGYCVTDSFGCAQRILLGARGA